MAKLMEKAGVERFSVIGTSYGGFVAYHVARMWPERVEKVVIASSGVNMRRGDNEKLLRRAKLEKIEHLMLPATAVQLQTLIGLAMSRRVDVIPRFLLNDFVQVQIFYNYNVDYNLFFLLHVISKVMCHVDHIADTCYSSVLIS